ncbi:MAG TPA: hypothetical protein VGH74_11015, partial [Planctomycetaceae bacterium]
MTMRASIDAVLGYLICGFLILAACEAACEGTWLVERDWQLDSIVFFGTIALCSGWIVSRIGLALLEDKFLRGCLKSPEQFLFAAAPPASRSWKHTLFPGYYRPLPQETRDRIVEAAERDAFGECGIGLFQYAAAAVQQEPSILRTLDRNRQLSGICRSLCVGFVAVSAILICGIIWHGLYSGLGKADLRKLGYCVLSLWEALLMV